MNTSTNVSKVVRQMTAKLVREYKPEKVILFGSRACGRARANSDIDLLIIKATSECFIDRWATVRRILSDPERRISLETIVLTPQEVSRRLEIGDQVLREILTTGRMLYGG